MRAYSIIAFKSDYEIAYQDATIEIENYNRLLKKLGISFDEVASTEPSPTNKAYMKFLITTCLLSDSFEGLVATLQCFWTYLKIAKVNGHLLNANKNGLYRSWCATYLSREHIELTNKLIMLLMRYGMTGNMIN